MAPARRRRLSLAVVLTLLLGVLATTALASSATAAPSAPSAPAAPDDGVSITLTSLTTVVDTTAETADGGSDGDGDEPRAEIEGRVTNTGDAAIDRPRVAVAIGRVGPDRQDITAWAGGTDPVGGTAVDDDTGDEGRLAPGESDSFSLSVPAEELLPGRPYGAAPISVQTDEVAVHTFVGIHRTKEYDPLSILWGVPVTLPARADLWSPPGEARSEAWQEVLGEGSALATTIEGGAAKGEIWLVDPWLLPGRAPGVEVAPEAERQLREDSARDLADALDPDRTMILPEADADVLAAGTSREAADLLRPRLDGAVAAAEEIGAAGTLVWSGDDVLTATGAEVLAGLGTSRPTVAVPRSSLVGVSRTPDAQQRAQDGTALLVSDPELSALAGQIGDGADALLARQRLVADSAAVLGDMPGIARTIAVVPARGSTPDPTGYAAMRAATAQIPWLRPGKLEQDETEAAPPAAGTVQLPETVDDLDLAEDDLAPSVLTPSRVDTLAQGIRARRSFASVRADQDTWEPMIAEAQDELTSARWRHARAEFSTLLSSTQDAVRLTEDDLTVSSGEVNFFAETGRLQITVENHTDVALDNLVVRLEPGSPILRIDSEPEPVAVGPRSRHTVTFQATALAPGRVPVAVSVTDPSGHPLSAEAELRAQVSPTGSWIYWAIGAVALASVAFGTWRSLRRRPADAGPTSPPQEEPQ